VRRDFTQYFPALFVHLYLLRFIVFSLVGTVILRISLKNSTAAIHDADKYGGGILVCSLNFATKFFLLLPVKYALIKGQKAPGSSF